MRRLSFIAVLSLIALAGSVQTVTTYNIDDSKTVPKFTQRIFTTHVPDLHLQGNL